MSRRGSVRGEEQHLGKDGQAATEGNRRLDTFEGKKGGILCAVDKTNGQKLTELKLSSSPVFDGMIAADGRLFLSLKDGNVIGMGSR